MKEKSVLVVFGEKFPKKKKSWFAQFDKVLGPKELEKFITPGSIQEANRLVNELPDLMLAGGKKISKSINWRGYELWWVHYDDLMYEFCLPYTQYRNLLLYLRDFDNIYLDRPPWPHLFQYFLKAHNRQCIILGKFELKNLLPVSLGVFIQAIISLGFLPWLMIARPRLMNWVSDKLTLPYKCDFRAAFIYKELLGRKIPFVEFIRSMESWPTVLSHAWQRKRPAFYSTAIIEIVHFFARMFGHFSLSFSAAGSEQRFWFLVASHYIRNLRGTTWSIQVMKFILRLIGVKAAIISSGCNRTFHELLGCKLAGIKTIGFQYAAITRYALIADFMPGFEGRLPLSVDQYGLWSDWWREYYLKYSRAYKPEQLRVSGPSRPREKEIIEITPPSGAINSEKRLKVLFISEQLAAPSEVMPYLLKLLATKDFILSLKFRPYRDGFEIWLKEHHPDILERVKIFRGSPQQAAAQSDVVVGSHSTAALEALLQLKPFVLFWTNKWGDYFDIKFLDKGRWFFADNLEDFIDCVRKSGNVPKDILKQLQERFFGNPNQNGSRWVVEQALEFIKNYKHGKQ